MTVPMLILLALASIASIILIDACFKLWRIAKWLEKIERRSKKEDND